MEFGCESCGPPVSPYYSSGTRMHLSGRTPYGDYGRQKLGMKGILHLKYHHSRRRASVPRERHAGDVKLCGMAGIIIKFPFSSNKAPSSSSATPPSPPLPLKTAQWILEHSLSSPSSSSSAFPVIKIPSLAHIIQSVSLPGFTLLIVFVRQVKHTDYPSYITLIGLYQTDKHLRVHRLVPGTVLKHGTAVAWLLFVSISTPYCSIPSLVPRCHLHLPSIVLPYSYAFPFPLRLLYLPFPRALATFPDQLTYARLPSVIPMNLRLLTSLPELENLPSQPHKFPRTTRYVFHLSMESLAVSLII